VAKRKITVSDWLKGAGQSIRSGNGMNPLTTQRLVNQAHDQRVAGSSRYPRAGDSKYYSQNRIDGSVDVFVGPSGEPTMERPHVHIVHSSPEDRIIIVPTMSNGSHGQTVYLPADASGNEVNRVVDQMRATLR
jgi:hypothetical protein